MRQPVADDGAGGAAADDAAGLEAAAKVAGLEALMGAVGLEDRLGAAGAWCIANGWVSVAHLRGGGTRAAEALVGHLRLKPDGARAKRLKRAISKDEWGWDAHSAAASRNAGKR